MTADETDPGWWAPIVYARTRDVDFWWRAMPPQMGRGGPEAQALDATIADDGARGAPRFVLARLPSGTLLGVACQTHMISKRMRSDGSRPVPCFIGWLSADPRVAVPQFDAVQGWGGWATRQYDLWMRDVWAERDRRVRQTDETSAVRPPWELTGTVPDADAGDRSEFEQPTRAGVRVYPAAEAARVWRGIDRYGVNATVVTGWASGRAALRPGLTHACAADFHGPMQIYGLPSAKPTWQTQAARPPGIDDPYATAGPPYGGNEPTYGGNEPTYGKPPPEPARQHGAAKQPGAGNAAAGNQGAESGRSGWRALGKQLVQGAQDLFAPGPSGAPAQKQPPAPPTGQLEWTLDLGERVWFARRGVYVYSHRIDESTIVCWHEGAADQAFAWTGNGWEPLRPAKAPQPAPQAPQPAAPTPEPGQQRPQPTAPGWQPAGTPPPKAAGGPAGVPTFAPRIPPSPAHGAPLDEFEDAPLPAGRAVLPAESDYEQDDEQDGQAQTIPPE